MAKYCTPGETVENLRWVLQPQLGFPRLGIVLVFGSLTLFIVINEVLDCSAPVFAPI